MAIVAAQAVPLLDETLPKKCLYCERRFSKAEHLKRHQRSHTGERPYKCPSCAKRFARSDVLTRHVKAHAQQAEADARRKSVAGDHGEVTGKRNLIQPDLQVEQIIPDEPRMIATRRRSLGEREAQKQMPTANHHTGYGRGAAGEHMLFAIDSTFPAMNTFPNSPVDLSSQGVAITDHSGSDPPDEMSLGVNDAIHGVDGIAPDEIQTWLNQFEPDTNMNDEQFFMFENGPALDAGFADQTQIGCQQNRRIGKRTSNADKAVPVERFTKVQQCWPTRYAIGARLVPNLWRDICFMVEDNIFTTPGTPSESPSQKFRDGCRRGLDAQTRGRLENFFKKMHEATHCGGYKSTFGRDAGTSADFSNLAAGTSQVDSTARVAKVQFPPAEILDIGLDLYFRHFHPLMPFVHVPTFCPKFTPCPMLLMMCLIGLTIIKTKRANHFIQQIYPVTLGVIEGELGSHALKPNASPVEVMGTMASGVLAVALAQILGETVDQERCQRLYIQLIAQAQEQRLFASGEDRPIREDLYEPFREVELQWKAWSRIESTKRLIICLVMCDSWISSLHHACPIIRTDALHLTLPYASALFEAKSATQWLEVCLKDARIVVTTISLSLSPHSTEFPDLPRPTDSFDMQGIFCAIRLCISEDYHRLLSGNRLKAVDYSFVPWFELSLDSKARRTQSLVLKVVDSELYTSLLSVANPNCTALWHNMCIMLLADIRIFERGAGCAGAIVAREALQEISVWTQTKAARRAILHAAQTFKLMLNRRVLDGDSFHTSHSLFLSALILGLYVFMVPVPTPQPGYMSTESPSFELLEEVNWSHIGNEGFIDQNKYSNDPAVNFIINGGSISLSGAIQEGGYHSARKILLDFAHLLEDVGRWSVSRYTKVLRIMSDALTDL